MRSIATYGPGGGPLPLSHANRAASRPDHFGEYSATNTTHEGDYTRDGRVDGADLAYWQQHYEAA